MRSLGVWSPDGRYVTLNEGTGVDRFIEIADVVNDEVVASYVLLCQGIAFSPDSSQLAVGLYEGDSAEVYNPTVTVFDWASGQRQTVVQGETGKDDYRVVAWLPDGRLLYSWVESSEGGLQESLWTITPGAGASPQLATDVPPQFDFTAVTARIPENVRPLGFEYSFSPDGTWLAFASGDSGHSEIYIMSWESGELFGPIANGAGPAWRPEP